MFVILRAVSFGAVRNGGGSNKKRKKTLQLLAHIKFLL